MTQEKRTGFPVIPIASNTNESFEEAEEHAEPVEAAIPTMSSAMTIISPGTSKSANVVFGNLGASLPTIFADVAVVNADSKHVVTHSSSDVSSL